MAKVPYINYKELKTFYTIAEVCKLFRMSLEELKEKCNLYRVYPRRNEIGEAGFVSYDIRKLHYAIYHEDAGREEDPWQ